MTALYRIGELAKRTGVRPELLRAWESRYALLEPSRSDGGYRLYSEEDADRIRRMRALIGRGVSAAEAARLVRSESTPAAGTVAPAEIVAVLERALYAFDEPAAHAATDRLLSTVTVETALRDVILPLLRDLGERWASGAASVAQEHFASNLLRGRLLGLAQGWDQGTGRRALLACAPGELHDIGLIAFGIAAHRRGWRIVYLGADVPVATLVDTAARTRPDLVVVAATERKRIAAIGRELVALARSTPVAIGGAGADEALAKTLRTRYLSQDAVTAGERLS